MAGNRAVTFMGPQKMEIQDKGYPKLENPKGRKIECAVILELVTTNICGSAVHIYNGRSAAPTQLNKQGKMAWAFPKAWVKSPSFTAGQCPIMHYNRVLMMAILWDRMPYLTPLLNTEIISLEKAPEAYKIFQRVTQEIRDRPAQHAKEGGLSPHGLQ